jgi:hypothetical protein
MARQGRFGHLPAAAPDLSATIVSMLEQYEAQRDRNIQTAWEQGGPFEGKKVTDQTYLAFVQKRAAEVSKDDPMYDYWMQTLFSLRFQIAESKANLQYQRENWSESDMAAFYRREAQKVPRNSEAWRDLMTSAAQFAKAARAARSASNAEAKRRAYERQQKAVDRESVAPAQKVDRLFGEWLSRNGYIPEGKNWWELASSEVLPIETLLGDFENTPYGRRTIAQLEATDPHFNGHFTMDYVTGSIERAKRGERQMMKNAQKYGSKTDADAHRNEMHGWDTKGEKTGGWDVTVDYLNAVKTWQDAGGGDESQPLSVRAQADAQLMTRLHRLENRYVRVGDITNAGKVRNRMRLLSGDTENIADDTFIEEDWAGQFANTNEEAIGLRRDLSEGRNADVEGLQMLADGTGVEVLGADGRYTVVAAEEVGTAYPGGTHAVARTAPGTRMTDANGKVITTPASTYMVHTARIPIYVRVFNTQYEDPVTGRITDESAALFPRLAQTDELVGYLSVDENGDETYEMIRDNGESRFLYDDPFQSELVKRRLNTGNEVIVVAQDTPETTNVFVPDPKDIDPATGQPRTVTVAEPRGAIKGKVRAETEPAQATGPTTPAPQVTPPPPDSRFGEIDTLEQKMRDLSGGNVELRLSPEEQQELYSLRQMTQVPAVTRQIDKLMAKATSLSPEDQGTAMSRQVFDLTSGITRDAMETAAAPGLFQAMQYRSRQSVKRRLGVTTGNEPVDPDDPEDRTRRLNQDDGFVTKTNAYYAKNQKRRQELLEMDPVAITTLLQTKDPTLQKNPALLGEAMGEVHRIRGAAYQDEGTWIRSIPGIGMLQRGTVDMLVAKTIGATNVNTVRAAVGQILGIRPEVAERNKPTGEPGHVQGLLANIRDLGLANPPGGMRAEPEMVIPEVPVETGLAPTPPVLTQQQQIEQQARAREVRRVEAGERAQPRTPPRGRLVRPISSRARPRIQPKIKLADISDTSTIYGSGYRGPSGTYHGYDPNREQGGGRTTRQAPRRGPVPS